MQDTTHTTNTILNFKMIVDSIKNAFLMLTPQVQIKNPVMFVTYLGSHHNHTIRTQ